MSQAFIIINREDPHLSRVCADAIVPALVTCGFEPKQVIKPEGLESEVSDLIEESELIVADLTGNDAASYFQVGYAMGLGRHSSILFTAARGETVCMGLERYPIIRWDPEDLDSFKQEIIKRVQRRQQMIVGTPPPASIWNDEWIRSHRWVGERREIPGYMEVCFTLAEVKLNKSLRELRDAVEIAAIQEFVLPFMMVLPRGSNSPVPRGEELVAGVDVKSLGVSSYWAIRTNGDLYSTEMLVEDTVQRFRGSLAVELRIQKVSEVLLYCARLYEHLGAPPGEVVHLRVRHGGMSERTLRSADSEFKETARASENDLTAELMVPVDQIRSGMTRWVKQLLVPVFELFTEEAILDDTYEKLTREFAERVDAPKKV